MPVHKLVLPFQSLYHTYSHWLPMLIYWISSMVASFLNWLYNLQANRSLSLEDFANLTFFLTIQYLTTIFSFALFITVNRYAAQKSNQVFNTQHAIYSVGIMSIVLGMVATITYAITSPWWTLYFKFPSDLSMIFITATAFLFIFPLNWIRGVFNAHDLFIFGGIFIFFEALIKLTIGLFGSFTFQSLPLIMAAVPMSMGITLFISLWYGNKRSLNTKFFASYKKIAIPKEITQFFGQAILLQIGAVALINVDVILVKHYFSSDVSGVYALISLIGKSILLVSHSFLGLMVPLLSPRLSNDRARHKVFIILLSIALFSSVLLTSLVVWCPHYSLGIILGQRYTFILPYIINYCLAIIALTIVLSFSTYHLLKKDYFYTGFIVMGLVLEVVLISLYHSSLTDIVNSLLVTTSSLAVLMVIMHIPKLFKEWRLFKEAKRVKQLYEPTS